MVLPNTIYAYDLGNPLGGIISKIKKYSNDPISDNLIATQALVSSWGKCSYAVTWNGNFASVNSATDAYLFPKYYTIRGVSVTDYSYAKTWTVHGYNRGEENDSRKWTLLANNISTANTYCGNGASCISTQKSTIFSMIPTNKGFEFIRFRATSSYSPYIHFTTSGIEFFGSLSINKKGPYNCLYTVRCKCKNQHFLMFITSMLTASQIAT